MKCFYHKSDFDGICSAAIVKYKYPDCELIGVDYDDDFNLFSIVSENEIVYIVDFCFDKDIMVDLNLHCDLHWIDHHKSSIEQMIDVKIKGSRIIGFGACQLTWKYLFPDKIEPISIYFLGRYDVWDHKEIEVLPFQYGLRFIENLNAESPLWAALFNEIEFIMAIVRIGKTLMYYEKLQNEKYVKSMSYEKEFEGYRAIIVNRPMTNSKIFESVYDSAIHDIMIIFGIKDGKYKYSLFSDKKEIDVSKIAVKYGGGGHAGASGFYSDKLLV